MVEDVDVLEENWQAVMVFQRCRPVYLTGMHKPVYDGIPALEIESALRLLQIPTADVPEVLACIDVMVSTIRTANAESPQ